MTKLRLLGGLIGQRPFAMHISLDGRQGKRKEGRKINFDRDKEGEKKIIFMEENA